MKSGDVMMIYHDQMTQESPEGKATLIEQSIGPSFVGAQEYWKVKFLADGEVVYRWIAPVREDT